MKESIGGLSLFIIVIALIVLFTGIMSFTVNRSNSFAIKDELISIIENNGGFDMRATYDFDSNTGDETLGKMIETIGTHKFRETGPCPSMDYPTEVACFDRVGNTVSEGGEASVIIIKHRGAQSDDKIGTTEPYYYEVRVYYRFDLPVLNNVLVFHVDGQTKPMYTV